MTNKGVLIAAVLVSLLALVPMAAADPTVSAEFGWGQKVRSGRWTPITIKAADTRTRAAVIDLYVPQSGGYAMRVRQFITLSPVPTTVQLYAPVQYGEGPLVTIRDADTGKT